MKKLFTLFVLILCFSNLNVNAYSISNVVKNTTKYEKEFQNKINLSKIDNKKLEKLQKQIESLISKIEADTTKSDTYKETMLWKLIALWNLIDKKLNSSITITIIDDKRCTNCQTDEIVTQLKTLPFLSNSTYIEKDFSDVWVSEYLKNNSITALPLIILSTNQIDDEWSITQYLQKLKVDSGFFLNVWAFFDPFEERSDKWFLIIDNELLNQIKSNTYLKWNREAKISWLEYSDLECPFCARLHNSDVENNIKETYNDNVNIYFNHFPLEFHKNALPWAMILECLAEQKWSDAFYSLLDTSFKNEKTDKDYLMNEAIKLWANSETLEKCVLDWKYSEKISDEQTTWNKTFGVTWTPGNVLINNDTWEYEVISWAYPFEEFKRVIDELLK